MIHKFSYDFADPYFDFDGIRFAFRVCTMENVYCPDPAHIKIEGADEEVHIEANSLQYAGGQRHCPGEIKAFIKKVDGELRFKAEVTHSETVKGITILMRDLAKPVEEEKGHRWPRDLRPPFPIIETVSGGSAGILPLTTELRHRRWCVYEEYSGNWVFNISEDQEPTRRSERMQGSEWALVRDPAPDEILDRWYKQLEKERGLTEWDSRTDVPEWLREVSLVLNMHCEAWTGFVFNTFDRQAEIFQWIAERIEGRRVLIYLPGWDGRYYWNYPIYEPSPECGGHEGLERLVQEAHRLGMHVIPMFGLIGSNYQNTKALGLTDAGCRTSYDLEEICDWTEWDEDLSTEPIWQPLNVGEPTFRNHLFNRICSVTDTYGMDGVFLDISGWMPRDPRHNLLSGLETLVHDLRSRYKNYLIFAEHGGDLHLPLFPLFHHGSKLDPSHPFHRYCRTAYHLSMTAPGRGSTGVHEFGVKPYVRPSVENPAIPTISFVQDTLPQYADEVEEIIKISKEWAEKWL